MNLFRRFKQIVKCSHRPMYMMNEHDRNPTHLKYVRLSEEDMRGSFKVDENQCAECGKRIVIEWKEYEGD